MQYNLSIVNFIILKFLWYIIFSWFKNNGRFFFCPSGFLFGVGKLLFSEIGNLFPLELITILVGKQKEKNVYSLY